jgi:Fe-S-cluster-containing dehydrogenase component
MAERMGLVANLERCIGCLACEVACKQEHALPEGIKYIRVETLGPYRIDGELAMDFVPLASDGCDFCRSRVMGGGRPSCVTACPTQALSLCRPEVVLNALRETRRYHICKMGE